MKHPTRPRGAWVSSSQAFVGCLRHLAIAFSVIASVAPIAAISAMASIIVMLAVVIATFVIVTAIVITALAKLIAQQTAERGPANGAQYAAIRHHGTRHTAQRRPRRSTAFTVIHAVPRGTTGHQHQHCKTDQSDFRFHRHIPLHCIFTLPR